MSYYQTQGDYYGTQGDPFFGALVGLAAGGISKLFKRKGPKLISPSPGVGLVERGAQALTQAMVKHPAITGAAGTAVTAGIGIDVARRMSGGRGEAMGGVPMRGFHMSKPRRGVPSHLVRNRRMRVTNTKALRRAIRRAEGFSRIARKVLHFTSPRRVHGRGVFRVRRRKK